MPYNGSGTFTRVYNWVTDKVNGVNITASRVDTEDDGFATGLTNCVTRDGQGKMAADFLPAVTATYALGSASFTWLSINGVTFTDLARLSQPGPFVMAAVTDAYVHAKNTTTGTTATAYVQAINDVSKSVLMRVTSSTYSGSLYSGMPAGEAGCIGSPQSLAVSLITNGVERVRLAADGSVINLQATAVQVNGIQINGLSAFKAASTSRNTTTTFASDPDLAFSNVPAGTYEVEVVLFFDSTASAPGFKAQLSMSGTVTNGVLQPFGGNGSNSNTSLGYQSVAGGIINIITFSSAFATATGNWAVARGTITLANTQTVALQWAQQTSSASASVLQLMSRMSLRRIA
jgi:hypothetical protein